MVSKRYEQGFKEYIAKLVVEENKVQAELSREHDIPASTIGGWVRNYRMEKARGNGETQFVTSTEQSERKKELLKEIKKLEGENEILRKAAHFFKKGRK